MYASIFDVDVHKMRKELSEENFFLEKSMDWSKGRGQKKISGIFQIQSDPPPKLAKIWKKNTNFIVLKWFFNNLEQFGKNLFF